ncbi:MAG: hypothetical protein PHO80_01975 [Candidatus Gracilibacteria bacterium]|nr:hypothetical protein [Candidatus Gracilibacteria bacterium]
MTTLDEWENIIKEKRKTTKFRDFLKEVASWSPLSYYKNNGYISIFHESDRIDKIISIEEFNNLRDNLIGLDYTYDNFFDGMSLLQKIVPTSCVRQYGVYINSEYTDTNSNVENCFLIRCSTLCKNVGYSLVVKKTENVFNSIKVQGGEGNIYQSSSIDGSFNVFYSKCIENSSNVWFSYNLTGCSECVFCNDLSNKSYCINNIEYNKENYFQKKEEILRKKGDFHDWYYNLPGHNFRTINSENVENVFGGTNIINGRNSLIVGNPIGTKNIYDTLLTGTTGDYYGCADSGVNSEKIYCSVAIVNSNTIFYSQFLEGCSFCLGCIGLKNKSFCILNKQYSKEDWYELADKIFVQMNLDGILGDFFPGKMNPFYFNDTMAYLIDDTFTKEEVEKDGYMWRNEEIKVNISEDAEIIDSSDLDKFQGYDLSGKWHINHEILKKVIFSKVNLKDKGNTFNKNGGYYRIIKTEYDFLVKHGLPIPEIHWLDRIKLGIKS